jgi:hypothetical protein
VKFRSDFITNSSSSSFIIGKKDEEDVTIESVYQKIRSYYKAYIDKLNSVISYVNDNPKLKLSYVKKDGYEVFEFANGSMWDDKNNSIRKSIERDFGIDIWDCFKINQPWIECETYKDYENYWINKMEFDDTNRIYAPFTIRSFVSDDKVKWLHYGKISDDFYDDDSIGTESDVLGWYYPYLEEIMKYNCDTCPSSEWCDREECSDNRSVINEIEFPEDKACLYLLGRICIHSECGYIPDYVVEKLMGDAEYSCNHMG